jgi:prepilin signal peptidase PulO-like enzyme (type II secretory pathway)
MRLIPGPDASYRYGLVFLLALVAVVFFIVAPDGAASRVLGLALTLAMLLAVIVTGRGNVVVRGWGALAAVLLAVGGGVAIAVDEMPTWVGSAVGVVLVSVTIAEVIAGLGRLLRDRGVTLQAVAGALALYLMFGLLFAQLVSVGAHVGDNDFFTQGTDGTQSEHVYFAFTTMTTTGYGDFTPATAFGRAIAVVAMLVGQIYLVTVIAMLVGNLRRRRDD